MLTVGTTRVPEVVIFDLVDRILPEWFVTEGVFKEISGLGFDQVERSLRGYLRAGSYRPIKMDRLSCRLTRLRNCQTLWRESSDREDVVLGDETDQRGHPHMGSYPA